MMTIQERILRALIGTRSVIANVTVDGGTIYTGDRPVVAGIKREGKALIMSEADRRHAGFLSSLNSMNGMTGGIVYARGPIDVAPVTQSYTMDHPMYGHVDE